MDLRGFWEGIRGFFGLFFQILGTNFFEVDLIFKFEKLLDLCRQDLRSENELYIMWELLF